MLESYPFHSPPKANVKFQFGEDSNTFIVCYVSKPPNAFQRWMHKLLVINKQLLNKAKHKQKIFN